MTAPPTQRVLSGEQIRAIADALGDTEDGLTGSEIAHLLAACQITDTDSAATKRHRLYNAFADEQRRRFDMVMAWSVDRLGRSLQDLVAFLSELHALGIDLYLHQQGVDTTTPAGKALFQMMGVFAEFERAMIRERVKSGLERAKAQGKILGRPPIDPRKEAAILDDLREGKAGIIKLAAAHGVGVGTVQRIKASLSV
jgi:DNA invertase Pin-like site-specific DNA recombinase